MKPQATRIKPDYSKPAENYSAPINDFATRYPKTDAVLGALILALGFGGMMGIWIYVGSMRPVVGG